ncbi:autotransporter outer membrane beta-barrel domain-containing protein [Rhodopseudomonas boonkerdii]|uniref:autotransporter family protein n=1 Tax=Rhodopseudomonas boonkerdii TaxID=475937 RepID=UPI001E403BF5|nr:autotransporter outer membrane beta-barrel domain-containing protein [Rhodopseudomonas boonkerdii]
MPPVPVTPTGTPSDPTPAPIPAPNTPILPPAPVAGAAPIPLYRPEAALYSAVPAVARQLGITTLGNFHDRQGDQSLLTGGNGTVSAAWGRVFGEHTSQQWSGMTNPSFRGMVNGLQSGLDLFGWESDNGHRDRVGLFAAYGRAYGDVHGFSGGFQNVAVGTLSLDATSLGGYWTHIGPGDWYIDGVVMHSWYTGSPSSIGRLSAATDGTGFLASLESGYPFRLTPNLSIEPQAQLIYQHLSLAATQDQVSSVSFGGADALSGRIGLRLQGNYQNAAALLQPYLKANLWQDFGGRDTVTFAGTDILDTRRMATALEFGGGIVAKVSSTVGVFAGASYTTNLDSNDRKTIQGNAGIRVTW